MPVMRNTPAVPVRSAAILPPRPRRVLTRNTVGRGGSIPDSRTAAVGDHATILARLADPALVLQLFDLLPQVVLSVKDRQGRYVHMSASCAERCGLAHPDEARGRGAHDLFPRAMADRYAAQDEHLFRTGRAIRDNLDLTVFPDRSSGWCLTDKFPLRDGRGCIVGLVCLSRDLPAPDSGLISGPFAAVIDHIHTHHQQALSIRGLARRAGLTAAQFERRMKRVFGLAARQYLLRVRIEAAQRQLGDPALSIAAIAQATGFCDQSALTRCFRQHTGLTPRQYRLLMARAPGATA